LNRVSGGRTFKIMKYIITEEQIKRAEFKYLDYLFEDIYEVSLKNYPDSRLWVKDGKVIMDLEKSGRLWVSYSIWNDISEFFGLKYKETQQLIKDWLKKHLKLEDVKPQLRSAAGWWGMEKHLKL
jgi:hypothetical protein